MGTARYPPPRHPVNIHIELHRRRPISPWPTFAGPLLILTRNLPAYPPRPTGLLPLVCDTCPRLHQPRIWDLHTSQLALVRPAQALIHRQRGRQGICPWREKQSGAVGVRACLPKVGTTKSTAALVNLERKQSSSLGACPRMNTRH